MTLEEAIKKAETPTQPAQTTNQKDPYAIPFEMSETVNGLIGKTLRSKDPNNTNTLEIVKWIGQNYVLRVNGGDYKVSPVMWIVQNLSRMTY
jgi:hypothetical protein